MADRTDAIAAFLNSTGWGVAAQRPLAGDASTRRYMRLVAANGDTAVVMDAAGDADGIERFGALAAHLEGLGLSPPQVMASDPAAGLMLLEDLGDGLFARLLDREPARADTLYGAALDVLLAVQAAPPPPGLSIWDAAHMTELVADVIAHYPGVDTTGRDAICAGLETILSDLPSEPPRLALRDYHAENLLWLPRRHGPARVGLLDFQDAFLGPPVYDLVSLISDARRAVPDGLRTRMIDRFAAASGRTPQDTVLAAAAIGVQRNLRIAGIFARLARRDGKTGYLIYLPCVFAHLQRDLAHPALTPLRAATARWLAPPGPDVIADLKTPCPTVR